jgi:hypothetical protein
METFALVVFLLGLFFAFKVSAGNKRSKRAGEAASSLDLQATQQRLERAILYIVDHMTDPGSPVSGAVADTELEMALACVDRINELQGQEHGPAFRLKVRPQILFKCKSAANAFANEIGLASYRRQCLARCSCSPLG